VFRYYYVIADDTYLIVPVINSESCVAELAHRDEIIDHLILYCVKTKKS